MHEVPLTKGYVALIDDADFPVIAPYNWTVRGKPDRRHGLYAVATINGAPVQMHNLLMGPGEGQRVDHRNGDGLDNRRSENLRLCTRKQNDQNKRRREGRRFKGAVFNRGSWQVQLSVDGKLLYIGVFKSEIAAARAYDLAAKQHYGEFANLNFPDCRDWLFPHEHVGQWPRSVPQEAGSVAPSGGVRP